MLYNDNTFVVVHKDMFRSPRVKNPNAVLKIKFYSTKGHKTTVTNNNKDNSSNSERQ